MKSMELLAPAGSCEILKIAIDAGADAVYLGGKAMNARRNAENFSRSELSEGLRYAQIRGKKTYITMNTLLYDKEIREAAEEISFFSQEGADALIVQDLGMLRLIREICPEIPVHASTQMSAHNVSDCVMMASMGIKRIVLARELSRSEIERIVRQCSAETEVFVHGALCMSVSGQCYFSSALGERSGNRGLCAQVCRLPFYAYDPQRYDLSLKDLSLIDRIEQLREIGVTSLKIEGRMKNADYVGAVVSQFRAAIDGKPYQKEHLKRIFSRSGFTSGYFDGALGSEMFGVRSDQDKLISADAEKSTGLGQTEAFRVPIRMTYAAKIGHPFFLEISDSDGNTVRREGDICQQAQNKPIQKEQIEAQLNKLGETAYRIAELNGDAEEGCFLSLSSLNAVRRDTCEELDRKRLVRQARTCKEYSLSSTVTDKKKQERRIPPIQIRLQNEAQLDEELFAWADRIYLPLFSFRKISDELKEQFRDKISVELPRIYFGEESAITEQLSEIRRYDISRAMCHTLGRVSLAKTCGFSIAAGFGMNLTNSLALEEAAFLGIDEAVLSVELSLQKIEGMKKNMPIGLITYGHFPVMVTRNCPVHAEVGCCGSECGLIDRKNKEFRVLCANGVSEVLNGEAIYYADKQEELNGLDFQLLHFTTESLKECKRVILEYQSGRTRSGITRGTYLRQIK